MVDLDSELLDRVARWCAEAGRTAGAREIRRALSPLGWDELLAVRALLADPPPARPLGPHALADIARGAPADVAAEREREGRYGPEEHDDAPPPPPTPAGAPPPEPGRRSRRKAKPSVVIRRARDREPTPSPATPARAPLDALLRPEGRAELERLVRSLGARRRALAAALGERWEGPGGAPPGEDDVATLLDHHGLARSFERRERDELLHALRATGGVRAAAAERLGVDLAGLDAALARLGAAEEAERIRDHHRAELRARATLSERVSLLLSDEARLRDLGLLDAIDADLRTRLPEHVRALRASSAPLRQAFAASLSLAPAAADALAARFALDLGPGPLRPSPSGSSSGVRRRQPARGSAAPRTRGRPGGARPGGQRPGPARERTPGDRGGAPPPRPRGGGPARKRPGAPAAGGRGPRRGRPPRGR